jgi:hypothetical protein
MTSDLLIIFVIIIVLVCWRARSYDKVWHEYENGNQHAKELLFHGFNRSMSKNISTTLIERALEGDEESKQIIIQQIKCSPRVAEDSSTVIIPMMVPK